MYTCGPTVYHYIHIGNIRSYIFADTLKRVLRYHGYRVKHVMNITDVGHLTSDADEGEDKMQIGAVREKKTVWEIAQFYIDSVKENIAEVGMLPPDVWCRATDHISEQIKLIQKLEKRGFTYVSGGNVYFDTSQCKDYGKLAGSTRKKVPLRNRVEKDVHKKHQHDFVLWFTKSKFSDQDMKWESPWGIGYPGWHIECSAMSTLYLGQPFDIHTGGIDLIPIHHTNEIAQSESATGKLFAKIWMHNEFIIADSKKMAKSTGDFISLYTVKEKNYNPLAYRFFCLQTHYRQQLNFTFAALDASAAGYETLRKSTTEYAKIASRRGKTNQKVRTLIEKTQKKFEAAIFDDLGTAGAIAAIFDLIKEIRKIDVPLKGTDYAALVAFIKKADTVLGLDLTRNEDPLTIEESVVALIERRKKAREEKRWSDSDALRKEIEMQGYAVEDTKDGMRVVKR